MLPLSLPSTAPPVLAHPSPPPFEVADIVRAYGAAFRATHSVSHEQARVLRAIAQCRTAALGGHVEQCVNCGTERVCYDSCRNRHCPKCQGSARAKWLAAEQALLLPIPYFHVVFTLPHHLNPLIRVNQRLLYDLLFQTAAQTLQEFARDPQHLGAEIGITAVLHTWGQTLTEHVHVHCVVTGGGVSPDGTQWRACQRRFLFAVKALGAVFRGKYLAGLERLRSQQRLTFAGESAPLAEEKAWTTLRQHLYAKPWVVYAKPPWGSPEQVLKYLSRYTHRVAIANSRLVFVGDGVVRFRYTDYAAGGTTKVMELSAEEFLRRFLLHVVPTGFVRIRHYGLLANRTRQDKLARARQLLAIVAVTPLLAPASAPATDSTPSLTAAAPCPHCAGTHWRRIARLLPQRGLPP
jgi:Putative transposase/Transposase zinc-binding domain